MDKQIPRSLADLRKELEILMKYGAPADELPRLVEVADRYAADHIALLVLHSFYSFLPEAQDDGIVELQRLANRQGVFLFCAKTLLDDYLYLADREKVEFLGPMREGIWDQEILEFFGYRSRQDFLKRMTGPDEPASHQPLNETAELCPACATAEGELHTLGCPIELCPWCGGQLVHCECRFDKTGLEAFTCETHLEQFLELLEHEGRIPYNAETQRPRFRKE